MEHLAQGNWGPLRGQGRLLGRLWGSIEGVGHNIFHFLGPRRPNHKQICGRAQASRISFERSSLDIPQPQGYNCHRFPNSSSGSYDLHLFAVGQKTGHGSRQRLWNLDCSFSFPTSFLMETNFLYLTETLFPALFPLSSLEIILLAYLMTKHPFSVHISCT